MPTYNPIILRINANETRRYAGLPPGAIFPQDMIEQACWEAVGLIAPRSTWNVVEYDCATQTVSGIHSALLEGQAVIKYLAAAQAIALLSVTIGAQLEAKVSEYFAQGQSTQALLLDAAGTAAVEAAADQVSRMIDHSVKWRGLVGLSRFSPGYSDWNISVQPELIRISGGREIGISVNSAYMLLPRKSITAVIGLVALQSDRDKESPCFRCAQQNCLARRRDGE